MSEAHDSGNERNGRRVALRVVSLLLWAALIAYQTSAAITEGGTMNVAMAAAFVLLFLAVNAQLFLARWFGNRRWARLTARLHGSAYLSEFENLPNRNYLLSELRREMPRARAQNTPFVLIVLSLDSLEEIRERRGEEFANRAVGGLATVLKRFTRTSDFIAHLGGNRFCVMLNECKFEDCFIYLQRVPGTIAVSDGHRMFEVPVTARVVQYDMEALYATDVLRDAEEAKPLRRKEQARFGSEAA